MVVDDDCDSRELMHAVLESRGMVVEESDSANAALDALAREHFDLLISDIGMPEVDGYSLIRAVRSRAEGIRIPAVALTAYVRKEDCRQVLLAGFDAHFGKPCDFAALLPALMLLLGAAAADHMVADAS
ncbi:MAG: response regulator [Polyangiales bacterium]